jgi:hypothetical protein
MYDYDIDPTTDPPRRLPWNKGKLIGAKPPLRPKHVWAIRTRLLVGGASPRPCYVQSCHRQQAPRLRCGQSQGRGRCRQIESTVRYLGVEVDGALSIAEQVDV